MELVKIEDYSFAYPDVERETLRHISLSLPAGSFTVLCGRSGSGKSTLLRQMKTVLCPHGKKRGTIYFGGKALENVDQRTQSARIGFVMQDADSQIVTDKVWHELAFGLESLGYDTPTIRLRVAEMASYFGIQQWFYKNVEELSGGQKQLLNLAAIMAMHPALLILDEPTSHLDPIAASDFLETVGKINRELGTTVLMTEHRLEEVLPMTDRVVIMDSGEVIHTGPPAQAALWLYGQGHGMFAAMPTPLQIYADVTGREGEKRKAAPLTVREGRIWLEQRLGWKEDFAALQEPERREQRARKGKKAASGEDRHPCAIRLEEVWFRYERELPDVVKGLTLEVKKGEFYCLMGGNGTGKSTALSLICRVQKPYRGKILINGKDIRRFSDRELYRSCLGVIPQNPQSLFVKKNVEMELYEMVGGFKERMSADFPVEMEKKKVVESIAAITHLEELMGQHPFDLSGGEQQRLALAKILLLRPKILLMDEPTKGMDADFKKEFASILKRLQGHGVTILMISHDIEFCARYADRCGMLFDGGLVTEGIPGEFFAGNSFYTTAANRMVRHIFPDAVTVKDVLCRFRETERSGGGRDEREGNAF